MNNKVLFGIIEPPGGFIAFSRKYQNKQHGFFAQKRFGGIEVSIMQKLLNGRPTKYSATDYVVEFVKHDYKLMVHGGDCRCGKKRCTKTWLNYNTIPIKSLKSEVLDIFLEQFPSQDRSAHLLAGLHHWAIL